MGGAEGMRLAEESAQKQQQPRTSVVTWTNAGCPFSLVRSTFVCLRGSKSPAGLYLEVTMVDNLVNEKLREATVASLAVYLYVKVHRNIELLAGFLDHEL